jgi:1,4-dihydroxy-2-naphthoate octaprenyltransferase
VSGRTPVAEWVQGARPRTLPAAVSPVLVGTGAAAAADSFVPVRALLALVVALAMQVGVNYANDYSDGVRGTDAARVGPRRLVASGTATPGAVRAAATLALGVAALAGVALVALIGQWWLLAVGAAAIAAAWFYTGGRSPYGYRGLGEVAVFVFFGLVATVGTAYAQTLAVTWPAVVGGVAMGCFACAILMANNLRDIPTDRATGKRTLAVRMGDRRARQAFVLLLVVPYVAATALAVGGYPRCVWAWVSVPLALRAAQPALAGATGLGLLPALRDAGLAQLLFAVLVAATLPL